MCLFRLTIVEELFSFWEHWDILCADVVYNHYNDIYRCNKININYFFCFKAQYKYYCINVNICLLGGAAIA